MNKTMRLMTLCSSSWRAPRDIYGRVPERISKAAAQHMLRVGVLLAGRGCFQQQLAIQRSREPHNALLRKGRCTWAGHMGRRNHSIHNGRVRVDGAPVS